MQQWLALLRGQRLADWGFSAASCGSHCRPSGESRSLVCVGLQSCSQRAAWPLSAALSYLSRARPDSQPGLPRHKGGLVLRETGVSNPPSPLLLLTLVQADACCDRATYLKLSNMERRVISATHSQPPYRKRLELHQSAHVRYGASTRGDCPSPRALQTGTESWLTDTLTDSFIVSFEERGWKALMKRPHKHRPYSVVLGKNYLFLCMHCCFFV